MTWRPYDLPILAFNARPKFRCVVCGEYRHKPVFQGQIVCGPCIRQGKRRDKKRTCRKCRHRFYTYDHRLNHCPDCFQGLGGRTKWVHKHPRWRFGVGEIWTDASTWETPLYNLYESQFDVPPE